MMLNIWTLVLVAAAAIIAAIYFVLTNFVRIRRQGEPPIVKGNLLWGSAGDFSQHAVKFLHSARKRYGEVFTIRLLNQYLTIVMDPNCYESVSREKNFDFDPIQKQVNWNVFKYILIEPKKLLAETAKTVKGELLGEAVENFVGNLNIACDNIARGKGEVVIETSTKHEGKNWKSGHLRQFAARTAFDSIFNSVFGRADDHPFNSEMVFNNFEVFHKYFNYLWLGFSTSWFPKAQKALEQLITCPDSEELLQRSDLSTYLRRAIEFMQVRGQTESDIKGHNLVYLHVNYNTFRLTFWALSNLLEDGVAKKALQEEIAELLERRYDSQTGTAELSIKDIENLPILDSIVQETTRLSSGVFMVRYINEDTWFTTETGDRHLFRKGDRVAIYPPAIHKDPEIFEEPLVFKYDRFIDAKFSWQGRAIQYPVMGFGTICPGKRFALIQLKWYIMTILTRFDMRLKEGEHAEYDCSYHGHEILPPIKDVQIEFAEKDSFPLMKLASDSSVY